MLKSRFSPRFLVFSCFFFRWTWQVSEGLCRKPQALLGFKREQVHLDGHIVTFGMDRGDVPGQPGLLAMKLGWNRIWVNYNESFFAGNHWVMYISIYLNHFFWWFSEGKWWTIEPPRVYLGKFDHNITTTEQWESLAFIREIIPFMAELFRLVNYSNLPG